MSKRQRKGTRTTSQGGTQVVTDQDASTFFGGGIKWMYDRIVRGGSSGHPLGDPVRYRWHPDSDTYVLKPNIDSPALRLFRRSGEWRITFDAPGVDGDTFLFQSTALNDPIYSMVAIIYATRVAAFPALRSQAMRRILEDA